MKHNKVLLIISILIPIAVGLLASVFSINGMKEFANVNKPPLSPPSIVFPIVWTILYSLMGYSIYIIIRKETKICRVTSTSLYSLQLLVNFIWTITFFAFKAYWIAFIILVVLWSLILLMLIQFKKISRFAFWLNIPYLTWITFAGYLNFEIALLN